jgi:hypothetical protein
MSQVMKAAKIVMLDTQRNMIPRPANRQNEERAWKDDKVPRKKAIELVNEVMVTEDPARLIPSFILSSTDKVGSV